jgi:L-lactate utilization protein LutB
MGPPRVRDVGQHFGTCPEYPEGHGDMSIDQARGARDSNYYAAQGCHIAPCCLTCPLSVCIDTHICRAKRDDHHGDREGIWSIKKDRDECSQPKG